MIKTDLIEKIIAIELEDFLTTEDINGKQWCQEQPETFIFSRTCQWYIFPEVVLESYLQDLEHYRATDRSIVTEKYAYMMLITNDFKDEELLSKLPAITDHKRVLCKQLTSMYMDWLLEIDTMDQFTFSNNRPLFSVEDSPRSVSVETYLLGEFYTYSELTLINIMNYFGELKVNKKNPVLTIIELLSVGNSIDF